MRTLVRVASAHSRIGLEAAGTPHASRHQEPANRHDHHAWQMDQEQHKKMKGEAEEEPSGDQRMKSKKKR